MTTLLWFNTTWSGTSVKVSLLSQAYLHYFFHHVLGTLWAKYGHWCHKKKKKRNGRHQLTLYDLHKKCWGKICSIIYICSLHLELYKAQAIYSSISSVKKNSTHTLSSCQCRCSAWDGRPGSGAGCLLWWCSFHWKDKWKRLYASCCACWNTFKISKSCFGKLFSLLVHKFPCRNWKDQFNASYFNNYSLTSARLVKCFE